MRASMHFLAALLLITCSLLSSTRAADFSKDIFPLLKKACFDCHGEKKSQGGLRLHQKEFLLKGGKSGNTVVPFKPEESELYKRVTREATDPERMPTRGNPLTPKEIQVLKEWIASGAQWPNQFSATHWAYEKPKIQPTPKIQSRWVRNDIDRFILARLEKEKLAPSPQADPAVLLRRLYFDLIGIPPSLTEVEEFLRDPSDAAYEKTVNKLLASDQFGVKWARQWLDCARYADSHGFQRDDFRDLWAWRDWVVNALNRDLPFDQFTIEQLAGDLIPNATIEQRIATGFNRNAPTNVEAGSDPEETRVNQVFDRVNTLGMVWLGTSLECAQCHDHKYDPFTRQDYYGLFAFFNNTAKEADRSNPKVPGSIRFMGPALNLESKGEKFEEAQKQITARKDALTRHDPAWETEFKKGMGEKSRSVVLNIKEFESHAGATHEILPDHSVLLSGDPPDRDTYTVRVHTALTGIRAFQLEALTHDSLPGKGPGRGDKDRPNFVLNSFAVSQVENKGAPLPVRLVRARASFSQKNFDVNGAIDEKNETAWAINPRFHEPHWALFECEKTLGNPQGLDLEFTLKQNYGSGRTIGRMRLSAILGTPGGEAVDAALVHALEVPPAQRSSDQWQTIANYRGARDSVLKELEKTLPKKGVPTTQIMQESQPRTSRMFSRGDFRSPGGVVSPATPKSLHSFKSANPQPNRLDLAKWLVHPANPLTPRVTINRWWDELFGQGLVTTPEDFGAQGEMPEHQELLDYLALELINDGWSMKKSIKRMLMSATYRQSSNATVEALARDPKNKLYARSLRLRLSAENIRDNALAVAGLLNTATGGPPIRPYQPEGLWIKVGGERYDYVLSEGKEKYRRGLYVVLKRGAPYPSFVSFDANNRFACRVKRAKSNTPLQALTLLNDPVYVEAAEAFARRILQQSGSTSTAQKVELAFRNALARPPQKEELQILIDLYEKRLADSKDPLAPALALATIILNLDEFITRE